MAYGAINEDTFYMQGGLADSNKGASTASSQFYSLDLTQPNWTTSNPPWKALEYPANLATPSYVTYRHTMSFAPDNKLLSLFSAGFIANYTISHNSWAQVLPTPKEFVNVTRSVQAATDPATGQIYIPGAYNNVSMAVYDFKTGHLTSAPLPSEVSGEIRYYTFVWSQLRQTFIFANVNNSTANPFFEYSPTTGHWSQLVGIHPIF